MITHLETWTSLSFKTICNGESAIFCYFLYLKHSPKFCLTTFLFSRVSRDEQIENICDHVFLQQNSISLCEWAETWQINFKCYHLGVTKKVVPFSWMILSLPSLISLHQMSWSNYISLSKLESINLLSQGKSKGKTGIRQSSRSLQQQTKRKQLSFYDYYTFNR